MVLTRAHEQLSSHRDWIVAGVCGGAGMAGEQLFLKYQPGKVTCSKICSLSNNIPKLQIGKAEKRFKLTSLPHEMHCNDTYHIDSYFFQNIRKV